jgi:hypothetical protein
LSIEDLRLNNEESMTNEIEPRRSIPAAPVHPLAALATIVLDNLFALPEFAAPELWILTIPLVGGAGFLATTLVQRYLAKDGWGPSIAKGVVMGIIAGVPISVTGTAVGGVLLAWAGLHEWVKLPPPKGQTAVGGDEEIVDAEVKDVSEDKGQ